MKLTMEVTSKLGGKRQFLGQFNQKLGGSLQIDQFGKSDKFSFRTRILYTW